MPPVTTNEPYVTLIPIVRSEIGDLFIGTEVDPEDLEFTDEQLAIEINNAFLLRVERDFDTTGITIDNTGNLSANILASKDVRSATVLAAAQRGINIQLQAASGQNIEIAMRGRRINFKSLVDGLQKAYEAAGDKYKEAILATTTGHVIIPT